MLGIGEKFPSFKLQSVVSVEQGKEFQELDSASLDGKWRVVFFWPLDFTFVCPTEIVEFSNNNQNFKDREAELLGFSCDSHFVHLAWRQHHSDLNKITIPMVADYKKELASALGILHKQDQVPLRATYIVDPDGIIRFVSVNDLSVGRNVKEVLRVLDALQTDELCPCNWEKGQKTL